MELLDRGKALNIGYVAGGCSGLARVDVDYQKERVVVSVYVGTLADPQCQYTHPSGDPRRTIARLREPIGDRDLESQHSAEERDRPDHP